MIVASKDTTISGALQMAKPADRKHVQIWKDQVSLIVKTMDYNVSIPLRALVWHLRPAVIGMLILAIACINLVKTTVWLLVLYAKFQVVEILDPVKLLVRIMDANTLVVRAPKYPHVADGVALI